MDSDDEATAVARTTAVVSAEEDTPCLVVPCYKRRQRFPKVWQRRKLVLMANEVYLRYFKGDEAGDTDTLCGTADLRTLEWLERPFDPQAGDVEPTDSRQRRISVSRTLPRQDGTTVAARMLRRLSFAASPSGSGEDPDNLPTLMSFRAYQPGKERAHEFELAIDKPAWAHRIAEALDERKATARRRATIGVELQIGTVAEGGASVKGVLAGGPAGRAGLLVGDRICKAECGDTKEHVDIDKPSDAFAACAKLRPGDPIVLHVKRQRPGSTEWYAIVLECTMSDAVQFPDSFLIDAQLKFGV